MRDAEFASETEAKQYQAYMRGLGFRANFMKLNSSMFIVRVF